MLYKKGQYPSKEEAIKLYITDNLSLSKLSEEWGFSIKKVRTVLRMYNITKSREMQLQSQYETNVRKYGSKCPYCNETVKQKWIQNNKKKYGVKYPFQLKKFQDKQKQTLIERYGVTNISKKKEYREQVIHTNLQKYGGIAPMCDDEIKKKSRQTKIDKFGKNYGKVIRAKCTESLVERYGVNAPIQIPSVKKKIMEKMKQTVDKTRATKKLRGNYTTSKPEQQVFDKLKIKFPDTLRQYKCDEYPFSCDFYIPSLDLFIEYNGMWLHGKEPFDSNNLKHKNEVERFKKCSIRLEKEGRHNNLYKHAIYVWTDLDVRKRNIAKKNNLNYLEFFNMKQFENWYNERN